MKLFEIQKCPICGIMRCDHEHKSDDKGVCPICRHHPCDCVDEQEEVDYQGKKIMVGKHKDDSDSRFDPDELSMGIEDEMHHTGDNKRAAKNIAKDHLLQVPDYYSKKRQANNNSFKSYVGINDKQSS